MTSASIKLHSNHDCNNIKGNQFPLQWFCYQVLSCMAAGLKEDKVLVYTSVRGMHGFSISHLLRGDKSVPLASVCTP